ncbi:MAG TPA: hypothetical protein VIJ93_06105 [bacterium]
MISRFSFLKTTAFFTAVIYLPGMVVLPLVPQAQALYWEDNTDSNDPKEIKSRPTGFFLFDWIDDLNKDGKRGNYQEMDDHDKGSTVNGGAKAFVVVTSGLVGLGTGLFISSRLGGDQTSNMFIGGAVGLGAGIAIGALIMPRDYEVDQRAKIDFMKQRQAWLQDPIRLQIAQSFHPPPVSFSLQF